MTTKDKLPVLARPTPPKDMPLDQAVNMLRAAVEAEILPPPPAQTNTRRVTAIHMPDFAMERWQRWATAHSMAPPEDLPVVLALDGAHGPTVFATNRPAREEGITTGTRIVDARALCPTLRVEFADIGGDQAALGKLMIWARRWCPWTAIDGPAGLVLDTTGSDHLWGGEAMMLRDMEERLARLGLSANLSCAPTHGTAWALSRLGSVRETCTAAQLEARIAPMPVRALRIDGRTVQLLQRLGLKTVGDLMAVPRVSLARRFNKAALPQNPLLRLDQMKGQLAEPISAAADPPRFTVQANLSEPVQDPTPHLPELCAALCADLGTAGMGARRITVTVFRTDGEVRHITVQTAAASRDADHIRRLFDDKLDKIDSGFGFDLITLAAGDVEPVHGGQIKLDGTQPDNAALAQLIDRLSARLGAPLISRPAPAPSHIPERAETWKTALATPSVQPQQTSVRRPLKIFDRPEEIRVLYAVPEGPPAQFVWRKVTHRVVRYAGPERIAPEWWQDMPGTRLRDYYDIEDQKAQRLWLYREGVWGDMRGNDPRWFIHGLFA